MINVLQRMVYTTYATVERMGAIIFILCLSVWNTIITNQKSFVRIFLVQTALYQ